MISKSGFQEEGERRHLQETPQERKDAKHMRRVKNEAAQVPTKTNCAGPGRAPGHFPP